MRMRLGLFDCKNLTEFHRAFFARAEIRLYLALCAMAALWAALTARDVTESLIPVLVVIVGYPAFEYALHRLLLHARVLCRTEATARLWWRIHYRHHAEPRDASVILAAPWTLIAAVVTGALLAASLWWSTPGFAAALAASFAAAIVYEYFHSLEHGLVELPPGYLLTMRQHHTAHHYIAETGNFGIVTPIIDRLLATVLPRGAARSPSVRTLGYGPELAARYPYIARIERTRETVAR